MGILRATKFVTGVSAVFWAERLVKKTVARVASYAARRVIKDGRRVPREWV